MKLKLIASLMIAAALFAACNSGDNASDGPTVEAKPSQPKVMYPPVGSVGYNVDTKKSVIRWTGTKLGKYSHEGTVNIRGGMITILDGAVSAGRFEVDMNSIKENGTGTFNDQAQADKLTKHLKGVDFFDVATYPVAEFVITGVTSDNISGNLNIKGVSKEINFPADIKIGENEVTATANFAINRTDWGITYGSGSIAENIGDNIIGDDVQLKVSLVATPNSR